MNDYAQIVIGNKKYTLPVIEGAEGEKAIDIRNLRQETGYITYDGVNHAESLNLSFGTNSSYVWSPAEQGTVNGVSISGYIEGESAKVYLFDRLIYSYGYYFIY